MMKAHFGSMHVREATCGRAVQRGKQDLFPGDDRGSRQEFLDRGPAVECGREQHQARVATERVETRRLARRPLEQLRHQCKTRRRIVPHGRDPCLSRGERACLVAHRRVVTAICRREARLRAR